MTCEIAYDTYTNDFLSRNLQCQEIWMDFLCWIYASGCIKLGNCIILSCIHSPKGFPDRLLTFATSPGSEPLCQRTPLISIHLPYHRNERKSHHRIIPKTNRDDGDQESTEPFHRFFASLWVWSDWQSFSRTHHPIAGLVALTACSYFFGWGVLFFGSTCPDASSLGQVYQFPQDRNPVTSPSSLFVFAYFSFIYFPSRISDPISPAHPHVLQHYDSTSFPSSIKTSSTPPRCNPMPPPSSFPRLASPSSQNGRMISILRVTNGVSVYNGHHSLDNEKKNEV